MKLVIQIFCLPYEIDDLEKLEDPDFQKDDI